MTVKGIDVSSYQSSNYATAGLGFVFVKATEGTSYTNPLHAAQVSRARDLDLIVGHYHFQRPGNVTAQAGYFAAHAGVRDGDLIAVDWEDPGVSNEAKDALIKALQAKFPNNRVLLYCNLDFWLHRDRTSYCGDGLWIADPDAEAGHPRVEHAWTLHQYSSAGGLDRNVANFADETAFRTWAAKGAKPPAPKPKPTVKYVPYPGLSWFRQGRKSPIVAAMHKRLIAVGCNHYQSSKNADVIGSGDITSYEAWQRKYNAQHHKGWSGNALKWPPGKETWDALQVPKP